MDISILQDWLTAHPEFEKLIHLTLLGVLCIAGYYISRNYILKFLTIMIRRSKTTIDDIVLKNAVFRRLAYIIPALIIYNFAYLIPGQEILIQRVVSAGMILIILLVIGAVLTSVNDIYKTLDIAKQYPIKSYIQIIKLILYVVGTLVIVSVLLGQSPFMLLSGLGAMTAILLLIFRDTILSFVAGLQITSNDLVKVGDWIEAPAFKADGDVIDIALHTVKVQNWDKTISVIPTHKLIDSSFKNWRGMSESGGRRIKRSLNIDMSTIRFCTPEMLSRFEKFDLIRDYLRDKQSEVAIYNEAQNVDQSEIINGRRLTNVGTFRAYIYSYLKNHPNIHQEMTLIIRQLPPTPTGLPLEIYAFTNDTRWAIYEGIQADIFDHLLACAPQFELRVFQEPSGNDFKNLNSE